MHHNLCKRKLLVTALSMAIPLAGCNGDGDGSNGGSTESQSPASISAQNATFVTQYADSYQVDLSNKVSVSGGHSFTLVDVKSLSDTPECQLLSRATKSFTIAADSSKSCDYQYKVAVDGKSASAISDTAITRVAVTRDVADATEIDLSAISAATLIEQEVTVDVREQLMRQAGYSVGDDFVLSEVVTLPYSDSVASVDSASHSISYTPPAGFEGIERILFSYANATSGEVLLGTLDIAVSSSANQGLTVQSHIEWPDSVEVNTVATIDVADFVDSLDGDDFQLIYVDSFNAATKPASSDTNNTAFTFETSKFGSHYVSFAVTDHNGAYAMGLMKVSAYDPANDGLWEGISHKTLYFNAPLTTQGAAGDQIEYSGSLTDDSYTPALDLALFDFTKASRYCGTVGRVPTSEELSDLGATYAAYGGIQSFHNWPTSTLYVADDNGAAKLVDLSDGTASSYAGGSYLVTCIEGGLTVQAPEDTIANGVDQAQVVFTLAGEDETPMSAGITISVSATSDNGSASLAESTIVTNDDGQAIALVSNTKSEAVTVCGQTGLQNTCTIAQFVGDPASAQVTNGSLDVDGWIPGSEEMYPVYATVTDENGNAVKNAFVEFTVVSDENDDSLTLQNANALTNENGIASVNAVNNDLADSDSTEILITHRNTNENLSAFTVDTDWGVWQWATPLEVKIASATKDDGLGTRYGTWDLMTSEEACGDVFGEEYRLLTKAEADEYKEARSNVTPPMQWPNYAGDPILTAVKRSSMTQPIYARCPDSFCPTTSNGYTNYGDTFELGIGLVTPVSIYGSPGDGYPYDYRIPLLVKMEAGAFGYKVSSKKRNTVSSWYNHYFTFNNISEIEIQTGLENPWYGIHGNGDWFNYVCVTEK